MPVERRLLVNIAALCSAVAVPGLMLTAAPTATATPTTTPAIAAASTNCGTVTHPAVVNYPVGGATMAAQPDAPAQSQQFFARAAANHYTWLTSLKCEPVAGATHELAAGSIPNWGGYVDSNLTKVGLVDSGWIVPTVSGTAGADSSAWAGIGGFNNNGDLVQAGTEQDMTSNGARYYAWYEIFPDENIQKFTNFPVSAGASISETITLSGRTFTVNMCNTLTSKCVSMTQTAVRDVGDSAEWVLERTTVNGSYTKLAKVTPLKMSGSAVYYPANSPGSVNDYPHTSYNMQGCNGGAVLATPSGVTDQENFTVTWKAYGIKEKC